MARDYTKLTFFNPQREGKNGMHERSSSSLSTHNKDTQEHHYLTPSDLAKRYQVTQQQITKLARNGLLPGIKIGKLWRFRAEAIEEWERSHYDVTKIADEILGTTKY